MARAAAHDALLDTVDTIYAAALHPETWDDALRMLARLCGAEAAGIRIERSGSNVTQRWHGLDPKFDAAYVEHYWREDPWAARAHEGVAGMAAYGEMLVPRRELVTSAFYNELSLPYGLDDLVGGVVSSAEGRLVTVGIMGARHVRFDHSQRVLVERVIPHLSRALTIGERLLGAPLPDAVPTLEERLRLTYCLTLTEARVAIEVGLGKVPKEVATTLGTSWNTVRSQLRKVFAKTRTTSQAELARLIARLEMAAR